MSVLVITYKNGKRETQTVKNCTEAIQVLEKMINDSDYIKSAFYDDGKDLTDPLCNSTVLYDVEFGNFIWC